MPSFILIRPTVWPQYINVTDRQTDRQDKTGQDRRGQRSSSIGRTVLQTVAQKHRLHTVRVCVIVPYAYESSYQRNVEHE